METIVSNIVVISGFITVTSTILFVSAIVNGYVLAVLWGWFIIPVFHVPSITLFQSIGLAITASFLLDRLKTEKSEDTEDSIPLYIGRAIGYMMMRPMLTLSFGWLIHLCA